jgi:hypothetical protein
MLKMPLPPNRFTTDVYPFLDEEAVGKVIPIGYGTLTDLPATEINTGTHRWKIVGHALAEISAIRTEARGTLVSGREYEEDLANGEFTLLINERFELGSLGHIYYFALNGDWTPSVSNYIVVGLNNSNYADGQMYNINNSRGWNAGSPGDDVRFQLFGKASFDDAEDTLYIDNSADTSTAGAPMRDYATHQAIGQSFQAATMFFPTRIVISDVSVIGAPSGNVWVTFYDAIAPENQFGPAARNLDVTDTYDFTILESGDDEEPECDVKAPGTELDQVADILEDIVTTHLGKASSLLDASALANLATDRTETLKIYLGEETTFGDVVARLEAGQFWKLIPLNDGTYSTVVYESGEPANTPHFRDEDFLSFSLELDISQMRQSIVVQYDEQVGPTRSLEVQSSSDVAKFFYSNWESTTVETFLALQAEAADCGAAYGARYEVPIIKAVFEVHGWALDLPAGRDKVKLTRARAAYGAGALDAVLFRIIRLEKNPETDVVKVTAAIWGNAAV